MVGGFVRGLLDKKLNKAEGNQTEESIFKHKIDSGILYASGLIAGEGLIGILLAVFAVGGINLALGTSIGQIGALLFFGALTYSLVHFSILRKYSK